jgi:hypothetical protein
MIVLKIELVIVLETELVIVLKIELVIVLETGLVIVLKIELVIVLENGVLCIVRLGSTHLLQYMQRVEAIGQEAHRAQFSSDAVQ